MDLQHFRQRNEIAYFIVMLSRKRIERAIEPTLSRKFIQTDSDNKFQIGKSKLVIKSNITPDITRKPSQSANKNASKRRKLK